ncbi:MAG: DMT family transporter [Alkaliphilus sp.]
MSKEKKYKFRADLSLLLVSIVWGSGFVVTKNALDAFTPYVLLSYRFTIATLVVSTIFHKKLLRLDRETAKAGIIAGLFLFTAFVAQTIGIQYISAGSSAFLTATYVVIVPFLYWIINKTRPDRYIFVSALMTLAGIAFITIGNGFSIQLGDLITILCAFLFACHIISVGQYVRKYDATLLIIVQLATAMILSIIAAFVFETHPAEVPVQSYLMVMYLGLFSTLICFFVQTTAQRFTSASHTAIILSLEAVFGAIFGVLILAEFFTGRMIFGFIIVFFAILTAETKWKFLKKS